MLYIEKCANSRAVTIFIRGGKFCVYKSYTCMFYGSTFLPSLRHSTVGAVLVKVGVIVYLLFCCQ
jgi:hypothetical protein